MSRSRLLLCGVLALLSSSLLSACSDGPNSGPLGPKVPEGAADPGATPRFNTSGGSSAKLFITETLSNRVFRYDVTPGGATFDLAITVGPPNAAPQGIAFNAAGEMFVANRSDTSVPPGTGTIARFLDPQGAVTPNGKITGAAFGEPHWIAFRNGELFVAQRTIHNVLRFTFDVAGNATSNGTVTDGLAPGDGARGVQANPTNGDLFVSACCGGGAIFRYPSLEVDGANPTYADYMTGGSWGFGDPHDMVFSPWGELFAANHNNGTVSRLLVDASGNVSVNPVGAITGVSRPTGLDFSPWGELFVSDFNTGMVHRFTFDATDPANDPAIPNGSFVVDPFPQAIGNIGEIQFATGGPVNNPPTVDVDTDPVVAVEGQTANNTGAVSDPDGDIVTLTASVGTVINNNDGTWSWSFDTSGGPVGTQTVLIDGDDGHGGLTTATFELTVNSPLPPGQCIPPPAGLVSWWDADAVSGTTAADIQGGNDGTLAGGVTIAPGQVGQAFDFNTSGVVRVTDVADIQIQQFSVDAWVYARSYGGIPDHLGGIIVAKDHGNTATSPPISWNLVGPGTAEKFMVDLGFPDGSFPMLFSANKFGLHEWHHVAATWDGATLSLYVNGQLEGTMDLSGKPPVFYSGEALTIGGHNLASLPRGFDGLIDEVEFFNRPLSASEIYTLYAVGSAGKCKQPFNSPPDVAADTDPVVVNEGQTANSTGAVSDPDGDIVTLTASVGTVINNNDGTWSWSFGTNDGPAESQTVVIDANDGNGGMDQTSFTLTVNNVAPTVDDVTVPGDPIDIGNQPVSASGTFSDPGGSADEPYTCTVDYGDGSGPQAGAVSSGTTCDGPPHTYSEAGVYTVTVAVADKDGDSGSRAAETFIVIYDPAGGFVTGGGWINSPPGAYTPDPLLTGKANFGFVSKYKKGATVPTGNTEFQFKAGDLNFQSSSYEWLVVNQGGTNAQFKGEGTINGAGLYKFLLWAGDDNPDTFRIKMWYENGGEVVVYDNGFDQSIGGGSIKVHKGK